MKKRFERCLLCALVSLSFALLVPTALYWFDAQIVAGDHAPEFRRDNPAVNLVTLIPHQQRLAVLDETHFVAIEEQREVTARAITLASTAIEVREDKTAFHASMYQLSGEMDKLRDGYQMTPLTAGRYFYPFVFGTLLFLLSSAGIWWNRAAIPKTEPAF